jgi:hypothetical protein
MSVPKRYTLWIDTEGGLEVDDVVLARGLGLARAADLVRSHDGREYGCHVHRYDDFVSLELMDAKEQNVLLAATVPTTSDSAMDSKHALELIDVQTIRRHRMFWPHQVSTDKEFDERQARIERRRAVQQLDRKIATELVDRLLSDGYAITCCIGDRHPVIERTKDRTAILEFLFDVDMAQLLVHLAGETSWLELIFDEQGWDVVADYSSDLEELVETIVAPHEPGDETSPMERSSVP